MGRVWTSRLRDLAMQLVAAGIVLGFVHDMLWAYPGPPVWVTAGVLIGLGNGLRWHVKPGEPHAAKPPAEPPGAGYARAHATADLQLRLERGLQGAATGAERRAAVSEARNEWRLQRPGPAMDGSRLVAGDGARGGDGWPRLPSTHWATVPRGSGPRRRPSG